MEKEEFLQVLNDIGTCTDDVERRDKILSLTNEATNLFEEHEKSKKDYDTLKSDNEKLREYNMKLFLQVGQQKTENTPTPEPNKENNQNEKRRFENLLNEKGELK